MRRKNRHDLWGTRTTAQSVLSKIANGLTDPTRKSKLQERELQGKQLQVYLTWYRRRLMGLINGLGELHVSSHHFEPLCEFLSQVNYSVYRKLKLNDCLPKDPRHVEWIRAVLQAPPNEFTNAVMSELTLPRNLATHPMVVNFLELMRLSEQGLQPLERPVLLDEILKLPKKECS